MMRASSLPSTRARSSLSGFFETAIQRAVDEPRMLTTMPITAMSRSTRSTMAKTSVRKGINTSVSSRPDEPAVAGGAAEGDEFFDGEGDLAGVEAGAAGQLVGMGGFARQGLEDRGGGGTGRLACGGGGSPGPEAACAGGE